MSYVVFEDRADATETKVHTADCRYYLKRDPNATTVCWHGPLSERAEADRIAAKVAANKGQPWKAAPCCTEAGS